MIEGKRAFESVSQRILATYRRTLVSAYMGAVVLGIFGCNNGSGPPTQPVRDGRETIAPAADAVPPPVEQETTQKATDTPSQSPDGSGTPLGQPAEVKDIKVGQDGTPPSQGGTNPPPPTDPTTTPPPAPKPDPQLPPLPPLPPAPVPTHKLTIDCQGGLNMSMAFGGRVQPFKMSGGTINGKPTELETTYCPKIKALLDQKSLPTGKTTSKPTGGSGLSGTCRGTALSLSYMSGDIQGGGTGIAMTNGVDTESTDVCLELRNIINGLMLQPM